VTKMLREEQVEELHGLVREREATARARPQARVAHLELSPPTRAGPSHAGLTMSAMRVR
jgi:hypothetical protein